MFNNGFRWFITFIVMILAFIPAEILTTAYYVLQPNGFWQKALLFGPGVWILGAAQIFFSICACAFLIGVWD